MDRNALAPSIFAPRGQGSELKYKKISILNRRKGTSSYVDLRIVYGFAHFQRSQRCVRGVHRAQRPMAQGGVDAGE